jgi:thiamine-monophosphate kinase
VTVQVVGELPAGLGLYRNGANIGDEVFVSGCTGDAAAALAYMAGTWPGSPEHGEYLLKRYYRPRARLELGRQLLDVASSAIDISDGLLADAGHICERSGVGFELEVQALPLSVALQSVPRREQALDWALAGGDDYELLFTVDPSHRAQVPAGCHRIGSVVAGSGVSCAHELEQFGYSHFSQGASAH